MKERFKQIMSNIVTGSETEVQTNLAEQKNDLSKSTNCPRAPQWVFLHPLGSI